MTERPHRSVSALRQYVRCGAQYEMKRIQGLHLAVGIHAVRGRGTHESAKVNLQQKLASGIDLPLDDVMDAAAQAVDTGFAESLYLTPDERKVGLAFLRDRTKDVAVEMARTFHLRAAPFIRPAEVEQEIRIRPAPDVLPVDLLGRPDFITTDRKVRDLKTTERAPRPDEEHSDEQLSMYALMEHARHPKRTVHVAFDIVIKPRHGPAEYIHRPSTRGMDDLNAIVDTLRHAERGIQAGSFPPTDPRNWWCSEKWCGFWHICPFVKGRRRRT